VGEAAGRGHDCTLAHPVCTCGLTWSDITEMDDVPICGERPSLYVVHPGTCCE